MNYFCLIVIWSTLLETYMVPFGTVILRPSRITLGLLLGPYFLNALLTQIACLLLVSSVDA